jgi:uncharacterized protein YndB with AHSA1/START domain
MSRIEKRVRIAAPRSRVWRALTDSREFGKWFGVEVKGEFRPGARVDMVAHEGATCEGKEMTLEQRSFWVDVQEIIPERTFSWRWHPGLKEPGVDYSKEPSTLVEFTLESADGGTLLTVVETGFDRISLARRARVFADNQGGWEHQVKAIASYVEKAG